MPQSKVVGLLAAVSAGMSGLISLTHGVLPWLMLPIGTVAAGLAAHLACSHSKKGSFRLALCRLALVVLLSVA